MKKLIFALLLIPVLAHSASQRKVIGEGLATTDTSAINTNFENINREILNTVHKTSTETIHGAKIFVDPIVGIISTSTYAGNASTSTYSVSASTALYTNVSGGKILQTGTNGIIQASAISTTTLTYLDASSSIQTQINNRATITYGTWTPDVKNISSNSTWASKSGWYMKVSDGSHAYMLVWFVCDFGNSGTAGSALSINFPAAPSTVGNTTILGTIGVNIAGGAFANWAVMASGSIDNGGQAQVLKVSFASGFVIYPTAP